MKRLITYLASFIFVTSSLAAIYISLNQSGILPNVLNPQLIYQVDLQDIKPSVSMSVEPAKTAASPKAQQVDEALNKLQEAKLKSQLALKLDMPPTVAYITPPVSKVDPSPVKTEDINQIQTMLSDYKNMLVMFNKVRDDCTNNIKDLTDKQIKLEHDLARQENKIANNDTIYQLIAILIACMGLCFVTILITKRGGKVSVDCGDIVKVSVECGDKKTPEEK